MECDYGTYNMIMGLCNAIMGPWNVNRGTCKVIMGPWNVNRGRAMRIGIRGM